MKKVFYLALIFMVGISVVQAQDRTSIGGSLGNSTFYGEFNQSKAFQFFNPAVGGLIKRPFGSRYAARIDFTSLKMKDGTNNLPTDVEFVDITVFDLKALLEFSFFDYTYKRNSPAATPYLVMGYARTILFTGPRVDSKGAHAVPFGLGYKILPNDHIDIQIEVLVRKLFYDQYDTHSYPNREGGTNRVPRYSVSGSNGFVLHNGDYYSTVSLLISYKFFKFAHDCPVYKKKKTYTY
jgi:hypothetical protein